MNVNMRQTMDCRDGDGYCDILTVNRRHEEHEYMQHKAMSLCFYVLDTVVGDKFQSTRRCRNGG